MPSQEAHHAGEVLRLRTGDEVVLFDGRGGEAPAVIVEASRSRMTARVHSITTRAFELPIRLTLATAMPRTPRQAYLIEKCTELGVAEFWPMVSERCVVKPSAAIHKWSRRAIEAAKQSHRAYVPIVQPPLSATEVWARAKEFSASVICCPRDSAWTNAVDRQSGSNTQQAPGSPLKHTQQAHGGPVFNRSGDGPDTPRTLLQRSGDDAMNLIGVLRGLGSGATLLACVGPEGGWSEREEADAVAHGLRPVSLGPNMLRIETAAAAVCAIVAQAKYPS